MSSKAAVSDVVVAVWKTAQEQTARFCRKILNDRATGAVIEGAQSSSHPTMGPDLRDVGSDSIASVSSLNSDNKPCLSTGVSKFILHKPSRKEIFQRTKLLMESLLFAREESSIKNRAEELRDHLLNFPASKMIAVEDKRLINFLKTQNKIANRDLQDIMRQCLALCGYVSKTKRSDGICILTIDGGGTRGIMGLELLAALEKAAGKKVPEMFDLIVGVSTGAIIATMIGAKGMSIAETKEAYLRDCTRVFNHSIMHRIWNFGGRLANLSNSTKMWTDVLKQTIGPNFSMIDSAKDEKMPRLAIISLITNTSQLIPYVFRNYEHPSYDSHYRGSAKHKFWEAIRASTAAPTYFDEFKIDEFIHQDGGILLNNPTPIALHEAKQLWPSKQLQCVISIGNGKFMPEIEPKVDEKKEVSLMAPHNWLAKLYGTIMESATETELSHHCISDLAPIGQYFRLNPYMSYPNGYTLDTSDSKLLELMQRDAELYVRRNQRKIDEAARQLTKRESFSWEKFTRFYEDIRDVLR